jgi:hypothetical protein
VTDRQHQSRAARARAGTITCDVAAHIQVRIVACGPDRADEVHRLTQAAFRNQRVLDPPSGAGREAVEVVRGDLAAGGGALADNPTWLALRKRV